MFGVFQRSHLTCSVLPWKISGLVPADGRWSALIRADPCWSALISADPRSPVAARISRFLAFDQRGSTRISADLLFFESSCFAPIFRVNLHFSMVFLQFSMFSSVSPCPWFSSIFPWFSSISWWFSLISRFLPSFPCIWFYWLFDGSYCFSLSAVDFPWWSFLIFRCFCSQNGAARRSTVFLKVVCLHF